MTEQGSILPASPVQAHLSKKAAPSMENNNKNSADKNNNLLASFYDWYRGAIRHPKYRWLIILGTAVYLISPIDFAPDIPIVGWVDDGLLAALLVTELSAVAMEFLRKGKAGDSTTVADAEDVIEVESKVG
jgi:uncharacterized membrane protein YkvA (DUF1232 family)